MGKTTKETRPPWHNHVSRGCSNVHVVLARRRAPVTQPFPASPPQPHMHHRRCNNSHFTTPPAEIPILTTIADDLKHLRHSVDPTPAPASAPQQPRPHPDPQLQSHALLPSKHQNTRSTPSHHLHLDSCPLPRATPFPHPPKCCQQDEEHTYPPLLYKRPARHLLFLLRQQDAL